MTDLAKDPRAHLWPSEVVTIGVLFVLKGKSERAFYRWLERDCLCLFPRLPERTRLFRLLAAHRLWADRFLAQPTLRRCLGCAIVSVLNSSTQSGKGEGRSAAQIGKKGLSNHRWIVGVKWCPLLNSRGQIVDWDAETANVHDGLFQEKESLLADYATGEKGMVVFVDTGFHKSAKNGGDLPNLKVCKKGENNLRMLVETLFSQVAGVFGMKKLTERRWPPVEAHLGFAAAAYNLLISWGGNLTTDKDGFVQLGIAQFSL